MENLAVLIGQCINWIILIFAVFTFGGFFYIICGVIDIQKKVAQNGKRAPRRTKKGVISGGYERAWDENYGYLEDFNKLQVRYGICSQIVPVFPLLGILGTVAGLIQQLGSIEQMRDALALSMSTTFWGLIAAILLRLFDALAVSRLMNKASLDFELYDLNYQNTKDEVKDEN